MAWNQVPVQIRNRRLRLVRILLVLTLLTGLWLLVRSLTPSDKKVDTYVLTAWNSEQPVEANSYHASQLNVREYDLWHI